MLKSRLAGPWALSLLLGGLLVFVPRAAADYQQQIEAVRAARVDQLTHPSGWLTLVAYGALPPGESTIGQAADNRIVLPVGPARFGTLTYSPEAGRVVFSPATGSGVQVNGAPADADFELQAGAPERPPTFVTAGAVGFYLTGSDGPKGLVVRDLAHPRLVDFPGIDYYPVDPAWRLEADWVAFGLPRIVKITNMNNEVSDVVVTGKAVFHRDGRTVELLPQMVNPDGSLLFVFADATSGTDTYAMRFLNAPKSEHGKIVLDFNLAENPPCAFSPVAICPLPPPENRLPFAIPAGERIFHAPSPP